MTAILRLLRPGLAAALLIGCAAPATAGLFSVRVVARDGGKLVVANPTAAPVRLNGSVRVEGFDGRAWKPLITEMMLVEVCPSDGVAVPVSAVVLSPGQTLSPPPWRGWSCRGQCETHCRSNIYWGSGPFRFRLTASSSATFVTNSFHMPVQPGP